MIDELIFHSRSIAANFPFPAQKNKWFQHPLHQDNSRKLFQSIFKQKYLFSTANFTCLKVIIIRVGSFSSRGSCIKPMVKSNGAHDEYLCYHHYIKRTSDIHIINSIHLAVPDNSLYCCTHEHMIVLHNNNRERSFCLS